MIAAEKRHEDDLYAALWKQDEQVKAAREVAETAEQLKRNQGRKSTVYRIFTKILQSLYTILWFRIRSEISFAGAVPLDHFKIRWTFCASKLLQRKHSVKQPNELLSKRPNL